MPKLNKVSYFKMKKKTPNVIFQPTGKRKKKPGPWIRIIKLLLLIIAWYSQLALGSHL